MLMYSNDYNGYLPARNISYYHTMWLMGDRVTSLGFLRQCNYIKSGKMFYCPDAMCNDYVKSYSNIGLLEDKWRTGYVLGTYAIPDTYWDIKKWNFPLLSNKENAPYIACARWTIEIANCIIPHNDQGCNVWRTDGSCFWFRNVYQKLNLTNMNNSDIQPDYFWDLASRN
jgi:hypothetical protein